MSADAEPAAPMFKKKARPGAKLVRKRSASPSSTNGAAASSAEAGPSRSTLRRRNSDEDEDDEEGSAVVVKAKRLDHNPLRQGTISRGKRAKMAEDGETTVDRFGDSTIGSYARATGETKANAAAGREDATREVDWLLDEDDERHGRKPGGRSAASSGGASKPNNDDGIYRGAAAYSKFTVERDDGSSEKFKPTFKGPKQGMTNVRTVTLVDYQPDVCKDYKETGYCGFGDTCKFLHDRSDYLAGWQLDALPNSAKRTGADSDSDDDGEDDIPFACLICRQPFTDPVVTRCGHYYCSACAIKRFAKTPKCFACGAQTAGIFNAATKVLQRMEKRREQKAEERSERRKARNWADDDEEEGGGGNQLIEGVEVGGGGDDDEEGGF